MGLRHRADERALRADKEVKAYLQKGLKYGAPWRTCESVFAQIAWEEMLAAVKVMNSIPFNKITAATIAAGFKKFPGPLVMGRRRSRVGRSTGRAGGLRKPDEVLRLSRQGEVEAGLRLVEAAGGG